MSPAGAHTLVWVSATALYGLHLSHLLLYRAGNFYEIIGAIIMPFAIAQLIIATVKWNLPRKTASFKLEISSASIKRAMTIWFFFSLIEIAVDKGVPIIWLLRGDAKTYFDFGIPSLHGFLNSIILGSSAASWLLYLKTKNRKLLFTPILCAAWSVVTITRQMLVIEIIEIGALTILANKITLRTTIKIVSGFILLIVIFGVIGNLRSGANAFTKLAEPTTEWPHWLPSGFLWVYIYVTTPLNNLFNTSSIGSNSCQLGFPATLSIAFPSVVRNLLYGKVAVSGWTGALVTRAFNVSTAYVGPYQDCGILGVIVFSFYFGLFSSWFYKRRDDFGILSYCVIIENIISSIFFDHFLYLPVVFQIFVFKYLAGARKTVSSPAE